MHENLTIFQNATALARHAGARQALTAQNVANADTPGYRTQRLQEFSQIIGTEDGLRLRTARKSHLTDDSPTSTRRITPTALDASPNGNTVTIEEEMLEAIDTSRQHNRAITIYRHAMTILQAGIGRR